MLALADYTPALSVRAAVEVDLFGALAEQSLPLDELAGRVQCDLAALAALLLPLAAAGLVVVTPDGVAGTERSALLQRTHPYSLADAFGLSALELRCWAEFTTCLRTGEPAFDRVYGVGHRIYRASHPEEDTRMDDMHRAASRLQALTLTRAYDWSRVRTVVDIGAGTGGFVIGLLRRFRQIRGVVFDLPPMIERAADHVDSAGLSDRVDLVAGDFFSSVPAGADVYVLKSVLGGWDDRRAEGIVRTVAAAMRPDSTALVIEPVLGYGTAYSASSIVHLQSLLLYGGPDRTREGYDELLDRCGLEIVEVIDRAALPIIVVRRR